ncbi:MAG TPA: alpha/beta family hydrolase [Vicinamibacterales bacterium]|nr:alpha/beta family hydrolase [Vicinamibacterales bacterium]
MSGRPDFTLYATDTAAAALVIAHGAGAGQKSPWMVRAARGLQARGVSAATFDFPYMAARRKVPDRAPVLEAAWRDAIDAARAAFGTLPLFIGGKSMGGRMASHVAAQPASGIAGVVLFGYPLHPPGRPDQRRDAHLPAITVPVLFVQGTRDAFGTADDVRALLPRMPTATLHEVPGGDHSFKVPGGTARQQPAFDAVLDATAAWILRHASSA